MQETSGRKRIQPHEGLLKPPRENKRMSRRPTRH